MKILFTGGGTGGHFYPIIAVAERVTELAQKEKIIETKLYFMSDSPYDKAALFDNNIEFVPVAAGKLRTYFSIENFFDAFKTFFGIIGATFKMFSIFPDVVFGKGGYASFPALVAARILRIPVIIHESDSSPGRVNKWAGKFAQKIALSFDEAAHYFPKDKVALTGQPIRSELLRPVKEGAHEFLKLDPTTPVIFVVGGSQGAQLINDALIDILPDLLNKYQIIHQVGAKNLEAVSGRAQVVIESHPNKERYHPIGFLGPLAMKMAAGAADMVISRGGSFIFEIASWGLPSIIIPITNSNGDHQRKNAFNYARAGACLVMEEANITGTILRAEIEKLLDDKQRLENMGKAAAAYAHPDAAEKIAKQIVAIALGHEL